MGLKHQQGMTIIGLLISAAIAGTLIVAGLNILPLYLEDQKMGSIFRALEKDGDGSMGRQDIVRFIHTRMDINQMEHDYVDLGAMTIDGTPGGGKRVAVEYEARAHLMGNLDAVATFNHEVVIR